MQNKNQTLGEFIINNQNSFKYSSGELSRLINSIRLAAKIVNHEVNKAGLVDIIGESGKINVQDEKQQKLDVYANNKFINTLITGGLISKLFARVKLLDSISPTFLFNSTTDSRLTFA